MKPHMAVAGVALAIALAGIPPVLAQEAAPEPPPSADSATREDVQRETDEAIDAVQSYTQARREAAQERARRAVDRMRERMASLQDEWARESVRYDEQARERRQRMLTAARERLELAQQRAQELEAASAAEWQRARERFIESYRALSTDVRGLVERSMPGRPVPAEQQDAATDAADADPEAPTEAEEPPVDHRDDAPRGASHPGERT